jgi:hypothetical protein
MNALTMLLDVLFFYIGGLGLITLMLTLAWLVCVCCELWMEYRDNVSEG